MFATVEDATGFVLTLNVAVVAPATAVTLAGTAAAELLLASVITTPPAGAGPLIVTVPVDPVPPWTLVGLKASEVRFTATGVTVNVVVWVPPNDPVIITLVLPLTALVVIPKLALVLPLATTTVEGVWAAAVLLLDRVTVAPPVGAGPLRVTVPVDPDPPITVVGLTESDVRTIAVAPPPYTAW